jgi:hypothetical protein
MQQVEDFFADIWLTERNNRGVVLLDFSSSISTHSNDNSRRSRQFISIRAHHNISDLWDPSSHYTNR